MQTELFNKNFFFYFLRESSLDSYLRFSAYFYFSFRFYSLFFHIYTFRFFRPSTVALITLPGLFEFRHFVRISFIPAASHIALTGPAAITPVPSEAGFSNTFAAPNLPIISCGIVEPSIVTLNRLFLALVRALRIASATSFALSCAKPTRPLVSPTTTSALKCSFLPPLVTLATRLIVITFSINSGCCSIFNSRIVFKTPIRLFLRHLQMLLFFRGIKAFADALRKGGLEF